jgi:hypothetical protein
MFGRQGEVYCRQQERTETGMIEIITADITTLDVDAASTALFTVPPGRCCCNSAAP